MIYFLQIGSLVLFLLLTIDAVSGIRVATVKCGGTIPMDSLYILDPIWSLPPFAQRVEQLSGGTLTFEKRAAEKQLQQRMVLESGSATRSATLFEIIPSITLNSQNSSSSATSNFCVITLDPLKVAMDGVVSSGMRFSILGAISLDGNACATSLNLSLQTRQGRIKNIDIARGDLSDTHSISFLTDSDSTWPVTLSYRSDCTLQALLILDRYGSIRQWYVWIPATIYSAVVAAFYVPVLCLRQRLPVNVAGAHLAMLFFGFLGSCIGLVVELVQWQSSLGCLFPFPDSVTFFCCLSVLYALSFVPVLYRQGNNTVLLMGLTRLIIYGLNCSLCVGYWVAGYVLLGSLSLFQYLATNLILTYNYARVSVYLRRALKGTLSSPKFSNNFLYLWCIPVTPFACCALMYYDLYVLAHRSVDHDASRLHVQNVIGVYNAQMSIPLLLFQNTLGAALLVTASAFHMPFLVLLFTSLLLWILHTVYVVEQYAKEWSRWGQTGGISDFFKCLSLSTVMAGLLSKDYAANAPPRSMRAESRPRDHRHSPPSEQYERDLTVYQARAQSVSALDPSSDSSEILFPPASPPHHLDGGSGQSDSPQLEIDSRIYATPSRQKTRGSTMFWPNSLKR